MAHVCSECAVCHQRPATQLALPCRHFAYCDECAGQVNTCVAKNGANICAAPIVYKQKIFQVHPNDDCPCSRCTICMEHDAIYAKIPSGSLELCGPCVLNFMQTVDLPYSNINLAHGDTGLLARIVRSSDPFPIDNKTAKPSLFFSKPILPKFPDFIKVERLPGGLCRLVSVDDHNRDINIFRAIGPQAYVQYLDDHKYSLNWAHVDANASLDAEGNSLLHLAAANGLTDVVGFILKQNPLVLADRPNNYGATPLFLAAAQGSGRTVTMILNYTMPYLIHQMATRLDVVETAVYFAGPQKNPIPLHKLWPAFFNQFRSQLDPNRFIHNNNGSTLFPLGATAYSIAVEKHFSDIAEQLRNFPGVDSSNRKPLLKITSHAESTQAHNEHEVVRYSFTDFNGKDEMTIDQFNDDNNKDAQPTIVATLPDGKSLFTAYYADKFVTSITSKIFPLTGVIVYMHGPRLRYMGELDLDPATDDEVPQGLGLLLLRDQSVQMGRFENGSFVEEKTILTESVVQLKNLAARLRFF